MEERITTQISLKPDEEGNLLVRCPECDSEFKTAASNLSNGSAAPGENITCPACGKELTKVIPAGKEVEKAVEQVKAEAFGEVQKELSDILKKYF